jgi:hypothetical protein
METIEKNWHVDTGAGVHETDAETLGQWIREGRVLPHHRISRGGMRWLEAGKVPQFAGYFPAGVNMPPNTAPAAYRPGPGMPDAGYDIPSVLKTIEPSFGLRLAAGSMLALVIAAAAAYAWAYHVATQRDFAALLKEPEAQALQTKFDEDKNALESFRNLKSTAKPVSMPAPVSKLGPARTGDIAARKAAFGNFQVDLDKLPKFTPPPIQVPHFDVPKVDVDKGIADLTVKFEADKKKMIEDARAADAKKRFIPAFALLFIGLGGLNVVRIKLFSKK